MTELDRLSFLLEELANCLFFHIIVYSDHRLDQSLNLDQPICMMILNTSPDAKDFCTS